MRLALLVVAGLAASAVVSIAVGTAMRVIGRPPPCPPQPARFDALARCPHKVAACCDGVCTESVGCLVREVEGVIGGMP